MLIGNIADLSRSDIKIHEECKFLPGDTYSLIADSARRYSKAPALAYFADPRRFKDAVHWRFSDLLHRVNQAANAFNSLGVGAADTVSLIMPNCPEYHTAFWGAQACGIANPINPFLTVQQLKDIMIAAETRVLVTGACGLDNEIVEKAMLAAANIPTVTAILLVAGDDSDVNPFSVSDITVQSYSAVLSAFSGSRLMFNHRIKGDDTAVYFHTGGTTGAPKIAALSHRNLTFAAYAVQHFIPFEPETMALSGLPLFHINGVMVTALMPWRAGMGVVLAGPYGFRNPGLVNHFWQIVEYFQIRYFSGVPTVYQSLADIPVGEADIRSLAFGICGAAPLTLETRKRFEGNTSVPIIEGYGLTEGACVSTLNPAAGDNPDRAVGLRLCGQDMRAVVIDASGDYVRDCDTGETGALVVRGPNIFSGYRQTSHNEKAWVNIADDSDCGEPWFVTGDLGYCNSDGYWFLSGRSKDLIIRGGHNIDPAIIEETLNAHPAVRLAVAIGRPDIRLGEVPVAYVELTGRIDISETALLDYVRQSISERAAIPRYIRFVSKFPTTAVGKIFKPAMVWQEIERIVRDQVDELDGLSITNIGVSADRDNRIEVSVAVSEVRLGLADDLKLKLRDYTFAVDVRVSS